MRSLFKEAYFATNENDSVFAIYNFAVQLSALVLDWIRQLVHPKNSNFSRKGA